jgi:hypothetical protein
MYLLEQYKEASLFLIFGVFFSPRERVRKFGLQKATQAEGVNRDNYQ